MSPARPLGRRGREDRGRRRGRARSRRLRAGSRREGAGRGGARDRAGGDARDRVHARDRASWRGVIVVVIVGMSRAAMRARRRGRRGLARMRGGRVHCWRGSRGGGVGRLNWRTTRHRRAEAVVDVHHRDARSAARQHAEQRRETAERTRRSPTRRRHGDHRHGDEAADDARQRAFHARDTTITAAAPAAARSWCKQCDAARRRRRRRSPRAGRRTCASSRAPRRPRACRSCPR